VDEMDEMLSFGTAKQDCNGRSEFICPASMRSIQLDGESDTGSDDDDIISEEIALLQIFRMYNQSLWVEREIDHFYAYMSERTNEECVDLAYWTSAMEDSLRTIDSSIIAIARRMVWISNNTFLDGVYDVGKRLISNPKPIVCIFIIQ
jgi:hypothetical protein